MLGGYINLDLDNEQSFSCELRSQPKEGETPASPLENSGFLKHDTKEKEPVETIIRIPPGHWIIFYQNILHRVLAKKAKVRSIRLYVGWMLTPHNEPIIPTKDLLQVLQSQSVVPLPSGQIPPMYSPNHISFFKDQLISWSKNTFLPSMLESKTGKDKDPAKLGPLEYKVVRRHMPGLRESGLKMYLEYGLHEVLILVPRRNWKIPMQDGSVVNLELSN